MFGLYIYIKIFAISNFEFFIFPIFTHWCQGGKFALYNPICEDLCDQNHVKDVIQPSLKGFKLDYSWQIYRVQMADEADALAHFQHSSVGCLEKL